MASKVVLKAVLSISIYTAPKVLSWSLQDRSPYKSRPAVAYVTVHGVHRCCSSGRNSLAPLTEAVF